MTTQPYELAPGRPTNPLYWSIRRELWENRSLYLAPLIIDAVVLFGVLISTARMTRKIGMGGRILVTPYAAIAGSLVITAFLVGAFYCLDALHGERRDRSILFWKSLPVSDRTTVLSKAGIPLVVLPLFTFLLIVATQIIVMMQSTALLIVSGQSPARLWQHVPLVQMTIALLYATIAIALWHAPIYAWLLLISAWTRRAAFLWAVLPFLALMAFEAGAFRTSHIGHFLQFRLAGWYMRGFTGEHGSKVEPLAAMTPGTLLSTPSLWIGLVLAALFLGAAVRLRRERGPI